MALHSVTKISLIFIAFMMLTTSFFVQVPSKLNSIAYSRRLISMESEQMGRVTMYKKNGCPHCAKATELLEGKYELKINFVDIEADNREEALQQMRTFTGGRNTVPQIFFNSEHLGGNDDIQTLEANGILSKKVDAVRKTPVTMMMDHWLHPWY